MHLITAELLSFLEVAIAAAALQFQGTQALCLPRAVFLPFPDWHFSGQTRENPSDLLARWDGWPRPTAQVGLWRGGLGATWDLLRLLQGSEGTSPPKVDHLLVVSLERATLLEAPKRETVWTPCFWLVHMETAKPIMLGVR